MFIPSMDHIHCQSLMFFVAYVFSLQSISHVHAVIHAFIKVKSLKINSSEQYLNVCRNITTINKKHVFTHCTLPRLAFLSLKPIESRCTQFTWFPLLSRVTSLSSLSRSKLGHSIKVGQMPATIDAAKVKSRLNQVGEKEIK